MAEYMKGSQNSSPSAKLGLRKIIHLFISHDLSPLLDVAVQVSDVTFGNTLVFFQCESTPSMLRPSSNRSVRAILFVLQLDVPSVAMLEKGKKGATT
ncbi:hypothetical protein PoB_007681100 [Plakobranchus ocellatus]|uniref:Uncharacterized protein n=1 Tax=Plakobranchus ocellatus TaxID=259542 RepID=A0AAV4E2S8_9GAST|nr:hypothetical protein PoB_007681100 [Plakobranchus ocellatus]